uniref:Uncharacterized protein n=1 Tax=Arundo donax TaxID=35708 RepID=A0A0A8ZCN6_ARUDO
MSRTKTRSSSSQKQVNLR